MERNFLNLSPDKSVYISDTAELSSREAIKLSYWNDSIGSVWHLFSIVFFLCKFQTSIKTLSPSGSNFIQSKYRYTSNCLFWDVIFILLFCKTGNINKDSNSHPLKLRHRTLVNILRSANSRRQDGRYIDNYCLM